MKLDKTHYSEEEFQNILAERRLDKRYKKLLASIEDSVPTERNYLCLKHGNKYSADYVNILFNMCKRHSKFDFNFYCLTENTKGIDPNIKILPLPISNLTGWWYKPYIFSAEIPIEGTILYLDLDVVISSDVEKIWNFHPAKLCVLRDFIRTVRPSWNRINSSVLKFQCGKYDFIWNQFINNSADYMRKYHGDQDYLYETARNISQFFPDDWIKSWKWEIRKNKHVNITAPKGTRKFLNTETVEPDPECCIQVFHGDPNPHICEDPFILRHWK